MSGSTYAFTNYFPSIIAQVLMSYSKHAQLQCLVCGAQGNLKGESVVAANVASHMEVSYYTSTFFCS